MRLASQRKIWILTGILLYTSGVAFFSQYQYQHNRETYLQRHDQNLAQAAKVTASILLTELHAHGKKPSSLPVREEFSHHLAQLSNDLGVRYLYGFAQQGEQLQIIASNRPAAQFTELSFDFYASQRVPEWQANSTKKIGFQDVFHNNEAFRFARLRLSSTDGQLQWTGAEVPWHTLKTGIEKIFVESLLTAIYLMLVILPLILFHHILIKCQFHTDMLTRLPNRRQLNIDFGRLPDAMLILLKIDSFDELNDFYGCNVGDFVLREFSRRCRDGLPRSCKVFRIRFDEFAILSPNTLSHKGYVSLGSILLEQYLLQLKNKPYCYDDMKLYLEVTAGIASGTGNIIQKASMALKEAQTAKKPHMLFSSSMKLIAEYEQNIGWKTKLRKGIEAGIIATYYRPIVNNKTGKVEIYECLARLNDGKDTNLPQQVLALARKYKLYHFITRKVIEQAFEQFRDSKQRFMINLSMEDFFDTQTRNLLVSCLRQDPVPDRVILSLMDIEMKPRYSVIKTEIAWMKQLGASIAIDDFGAGVTTLKCLSQLPVDIIKLDVSIVKLISKNDARHYIPKAIVDITQKLHIETIAKAVRSEAIHKAVKGIKIDYSQGTHIGEPKLSVKSLL